MAGSAGVVYIDIEVAKKKLKASFEEAKKDISGSMKKIGASMTSAGKTMSMALTLPILGVGAAIAKVAGDYEVQMNRVKALTGSTGTQFENLQEQARNLGSTTQFSASQAAEGMGFLAQAGFDANEIIASMPATLSLASAAQIELAEAADVASNVLSGYRMKADELESAIDVMVATTAKSNTNFQQMGEAMKYAGPVAKSAGVEFEDTAAAIGLMGNAGIQGTMAGTSLRSAITKLLKPTNEAAVSMKKLGLDVTDSEGRLIPFRDIVAQLGPVADKTSDIMTIFGLRAGPAMAAMAGQGVEEFDKLTVAIEENAGITKELEKAYTESLPGKLKALRSAVEELLLTLADAGFMDALKDIINYFRELAIKASELDPRILKIGMVIAGVAAAVGPLLIVFGTLLTAVGTITGALGSLGVGMTLVGTTASVGLLPVIAALAGAAGLGLLLTKIPIVNTALKGLGEWIWSVANKIPLMKGGAEDLAAAWGAVTGETMMVEKASTELEKSLVTLNRELKKHNLDVDRGTMSIDEWYDATVKATVEASKLGKEIKDTGKEFSITGREIFQTEVEVGELSDGLTRSLVPSLEESSKSAEELKTEFDKQVDAIKAAKAEIKEWSDEMQSALDPGKDLENQLEFLRDKFGDNKVIQIYGEEVEKVYEEYQRLGGQVPENIQQLMTLVTETDNASRANADLKVSFENLFPAVETAEASIDDLIDKVDVLSGTTIPGVITEVDTLPDAFKDSFSDAKTKMDEEDLSGFMDKQISTIQDSFVDGLADILTGEGGWESFGDSLESIAGTFIDAVIKVFLDTLFTPLLAAFASFFSGDGFNLSGSAFSGIGALFSGTATAATTAATSTTLMGYGATAATTAATVGGTAATVGGTAGTATGMGAITGGATGLSGAAIAAANLLFPAMVIVGMFTGNDIESGGRLAPGQAYNTTLAGTGENIDLGSAWFSGADWNDLTSQLPGQTMTVDQIANLGIDTDAWLNTQQETADVNHEDLMLIKDELTKPANVELNFHIKAIDGADVEDVVVRSIIPILEDKMKTREFAI